MRQKVSEKQSWKEKGEKILNDILKTNFQIKEIERYAKNIKARLKDIEEVCTQHVLRIKKYRPPEGIDIKKLCGGLECVEKKIGYIETAASLLSNKIENESEIENLSNAIKIYDNDMKNYIKELLKHYEIRKRYQ